MNGAEWRVNQNRNSLEVSFPGKPDSSTIAALKQNGFRWAPSSRVWYAKDYQYRRDFLATIAERGEDVEPSGLSFAEKMQEKAERAEARRERLEEWAQSAQAEANRRFETAHNLIKGIPMGQPILVGHHSERAHRRTLERHDANMSKAFESQRRAEYHAGRAASTGAQLKGYDRPDFLARRVKECEAEIRRLDRNKDRYAGDMDNWQRYRDKAQSKLVFCRERLAELGEVRFSRENINKGDVILGEFGLGIVRRVNPTTVTVDYLNPAIALLNPCKCEYGRIKERKTVAETIALLESKLAASDDSPALAAVLDNLRKWSA